MKKRALFSLYDTDKALGFAEDLIKLGWEIIGSSEVSEVLSKNGLSVEDISDFTGVKENYGFPPTLHPKVEWYLTSTNAKERIDLVYVINYPMDIGNDIGGRTLLGLAAKGNRIPVMSIEDMDMVISDLKKNGKISMDLHSKLLDKTNAFISNHYFDLVKDRMRYDAIFGEFKYSLLNGENPYQVPAAFYSVIKKDTLSLSNFNQISGEVPCFTNLADSDCIIQTMCICAEAFKVKYKKVPYICIASKHGNPCGMAIDWKTPVNAVNKALFGNFRAIWGGEVITNFEIDMSIADLLFKSSEREKITGRASWMLDIIIAPSFTRESLEILGRRKQRKLFENSALFDPFIEQSKWSYRFVRGGFLRQPPHSYVLNLDETEYIGEEVKGTIIDSLILAWSVAYSSNQGGNEIAIVKNASLINCGGGPSTVEAVELALIRAKNLGHDSTSAVFAADAFFPFVDAPELLVNAGLIAGIVPCGGKAIEDVKSFFRKNQIGMYYLSEQYRGFCRH